MGMSARKLLYLALVATGLWANVAGAQAVSRLGLLERRAQLQLQLGLVDYSTVDGELESTLNEGSSVATKSGRYGLSSRIGLVLGYGVTEKVQLALFAGFAVHSSSSRPTIGGVRGDEAHAKSGEVQIIPALRYVAGEGGQRFYVGAAAGFARESSELGSDGTNTVSKHGLLGGQLGLYWFIHQHVSLEPGLELYYLTGSTQQTRSRVAQAELHYNDHGFRMMLTLGVSLWAGGDDHAAPVASAAPPDRERALPADQTQYGAARIDDLSVRLLGSPQRMGTEVTLGLTTHGGDEPPGCAVTLLSDEPPQQLSFDWWLDGADETGPLQSGLGPARVKQLEQWLAHNPSLVVCKRVYVVRVEVRAELQAALARFQGDAASAGTRQPEPVSAAPDEARLKSATP